MSVSVHSEVLCRGQTLAPFAIGRAMQLAPKSITSLYTTSTATQHELLTPQQTQAEIARLIAAFDKAIQALTLALQPALQYAPAEAALDAGDTSEVQPKDTLTQIAQVHLLLLQDATFSEEVAQLIEEKNCSAERALAHYRQYMSTQFDAVQDSYLRTRKNDVQQVIDQVLDNLTLRDVDATMASPNTATELSTQDALSSVDTQEPFVLIAHELTPLQLLQLLQLNKASLLALVLDDGSKHSHTAIIAKSLGIPVLVGAHCASQLVRPLELVIVDALAGVLIIDPAANVLMSYQAEQQRLTQQAVDQIPALAKTTPSLLVTAGGQQVQLLVNIASPSQAQQAYVQGAHGVGLFRTEFLFIGRKDLPSEQEQYLVYRETLLAMPGLPVTIRTLDIGADKLLAVPQLIPTATSRRGIRRSLAEPELFLIQLRALLRAAVDGELRVMFPMLCSEDEIKQTLALLEQAKAELTAQGMAFGEPKLGAMIEVPAAALIVPVFLKYFDFLSIGTNDLIQYTLAVDRSDEQTARILNAHHPAIGILLATVIQQCIRQGKSVSVCGEMAGETVHTQTLLDWGLRSFSVDPSRLSEMTNCLLKAQ